MNWRQVIGFRMKRHQLDERAPAGEMLEIAGRLCGLHAQLMSSAELSLWARTRDLPREAVRQALWKEGSLIKTWAMRGTLHLLTPQDAGTFLSLIAAGRSWERPSWQRYFGVTPSTMERLRAVVPEEAPIRRVLELADAAAAISLSPDVRAALGGLDSD